MKQRADRLLVTRGLVESRTRAQALIAAGLVLCDGRPLVKASQGLEETADLIVTGRDHPWVSRGGVKLAAALDVFDLDPAGLVCLDLGASTGGFVDVLLSRAAAKVYAVDVGRGQLSPRLSADPRVVSLERTDARALTRALIPEPIDLLSADLSFISLTLGLPAALPLVAPGGRLAALVKPQFEAGPAAIGKGGILRDPTVRSAAVVKVRDWLAAQADWTVEQLVDSPISGSDGNRESLLSARKSL
ncbi:TlyA family RNA methyltransferase [Algihabitans albus]|uniref:TlyA family RNA methyltransferase n=1 Tax=Algihabitans albus TaxID=2164067 RepID=UPI000E5D472A|nr:TlyA family RNA methyltransferase [Algihabitans albus]